MPDNEMEEGILYEQASYFTDTTSATYSDEWLPALYGEIEAIEVIQGRKGSLLDVGCGGGGLVYAAQQLGWNAFGIDVSKVAVDLSRKKWGLSTIFQTNLADFNPQQQFNVITAYHVLEHLYDPHQVLAKIKDLLDPDGLAMDIECLV